jgi:hypothetical protein
MTPTIETLNQKIAQLELERSNLPNFDPNELERQIQEHAARAIPGLDGADLALTPDPIAIIGKSIIGNSDQPGSRSSVFSMSADAKPASNPITRPTQPCKARAHRSP